MRTKPGHRLRQHPLLALGAATLAGWAGLQALQRAGRRGWRQAEVTDELEHLPKASLKDTLLFLNDVALPTLGKGVLLRRPRILAAADKLDQERRAVARMQALRERYGAGPLLLAFPGRVQAVLLSPDHVHRVLDQTPEPFASASIEKRAALKGTSKNHLVHGMMTPHQP